MANPSPEDVAAQMERLMSHKQFRGPKIRSLLRFVVDEWLVDGGSRLTLKYICETLTHEPLTFEQDTEKWGYPKTRANLAHVRNRLRTYFETNGYRDQVIVKLNPGSYAPVVAYNPVSTSIPDLDPEVIKLVLRAKTAIDLRTHVGALKALNYWQRIPLSVTNPRQIANFVFIPMAVASIMPSAVAAMAPHLETLIGKVREMGVEPWECIFAEACGDVCYKHQWSGALTSFELAIDVSQGEARYFWWYTALLASLGRREEAISILEDAVRHFSRTNIAMRTDLALLQIMSGRFAEAEEHLLASLDFAQPDNPLIASHLALLYEAQDRLGEAIVPLVHLLRLDTQIGAHPRIKGAKQFGDGYVLLNGLLALIMGRAGAMDAATQMLEILLACKAEIPTASSIEVALAFIGLGRFDEAVLWLNQAAFEEADPMAMWFHILPPLRHLRDNKAFRELLGKLNLPLQPNL